MKISVHKTDPGYLDFLRLRNNGPVRIYLNEVLQKRVTIADEEEGFIVRHVLNERGEPQLDPSNPQRVWTEKVFGEVRVAREVEPVS